ncbi:hypothetical protein HYDPIDRAFT_167947 [Hydnomerulius pinastri MD-312]|uniref:Unplaced genomic scaffold scaffold_13, whole genome shotgun sequence n=1 Tax=Hydnomerulius pinastri MD-312 TaxID=994086 RepID=A0A0C9W0E1_9AGAM|nr:hypothetical protein HYDPIDRAFT_167947 [Hydnomerulius pinastri MD-312]
MSPRDLVPRQSGGETASETASGTQASSLPTNTDVTDTASPTNSLQGTSTQFAGRAVEQLFSELRSTNFDDKPQHDCPTLNNKCVAAPDHYTAFVIHDPEPDFQLEFPYIHPLFQYYTPFIPIPIILATTNFDHNTPARVGDANNNHIFLYDLPQWNPGCSGAAVLIIIVLSIAFYSRRKHFKRLKFLDAITSRRKQAHSRAMLLAGEDLDDVDLARPPPGRYSDYETPWDGSSPPGSQRSLMGAAPRPPTHRSTPSDTGSAFREDVWPPPSETSRLMDPLARGADVDLSRIVDDVMGPPVHAVHFSQQSISSSHRGSGYESDGSRGEELHSRNLSNTSQVALLEAAGLAPVTATTNAPARSSPLTQAGNSPSSAGHGGGDPS